MFLQSICSVLEQVWRKVSIDFFSHYYSTYSALLTLLTIQVTYAGYTILNTVSYRKYNYLQYGLLTLLTINTLLTLLAEQLILIIWNYLPVLINIDSYLHVPLAGQWLWRNLRYWTTAHRPWRWHWYSYWGDEQ